MIVSAFHGVLIWACKHELFIDLIFVSKSCNLSPPSSMPFIRASYFNLRLFIVSDEILNIHIILFYNHFKLFNYRCYMVHFW